MDCPNCGNYITNTASIGFVECEYCRTKVAAMQLATEYSSVDILGKESPDEAVKLSQEMDLAKVDLQNRNYNEAWTCYDRILREHPTFWEAMINKAICEFWLGREDFSHLRDIETLLQKADTLSDGNPLVTKTRRDIAYNLAVVGKTREAYGDDIEWSLRAFELSRSLAPSSLERDSVMEEYVGNCLRSLSSRMLRDAANRKKKYDPPNTELNTLYRIASLNVPSSTESMRMFLAFGNYKARRSSGHNLADQLSRIRTEWQSGNSKKPDPRLDFPLIGKPRIS